MNSLLFKFAFFAFLLTSLSANAASLELQGQCARQARTFFKQEGLATKDETISTDFVNHYDETSGKCFIGIKHSYQTQTDKGYVIWTQELVMDAFEGISYADYLSNNDKIYWKYQPISCYIKKPSGERIDCHSTDEFDALIHTNFGVILE